MFILKVSAKLHSAPNQAQNTKSDTIGTVHFSLFMKQLINPPGERIHPEHLTQGGNYYDSTTQYYSNELQQNVGLNN